MHMTSNVLLCAYLYTHKSLSEKLLFIGNSRKNGSQLIKMRRIIHCGVIDPKWDVRSTHFSPKAQRTLGENTQKECKSQTSGRFTPKQCLLVMIWPSLSPRTPWSYGYLHKVQRAELIIVSSCTREGIKRFHFSLRVYGQAVNKYWRKESIFLYVSTNKLPVIQWTTLKSFSYKQP